MDYRLRHRGHDLRLGSDGFTIGRSHECDLQIHDESVSRIHARLTLVDDTAWIEDLDSRNGIEINGKQIDEATRVDHGDEISVGAQRFVLIEIGQLRSEVGGPLSTTSTNINAYNEQSVFEMLTSAGRRALRDGMLSYAKQVGEHLFHAISSPPKHAPAPSPKERKAASAFALKLAERTHDPRWTERAEEANRLAELDPEQRDSTPDPLVGRTIAAKYRLISLIGRGTMGRVYQAEQVKLNRTVALKIVHPHLARHERSRSRFDAEARAASRLAHPNSVGIIDFGTTDDDLLFIVMELLDGEPLAEAQKAGLLPIDRVRAIVTSVLGALAEAHANGVVHRDLKPENIVLTRVRDREVVKVVDFGLATVHDHDGGRMTPQGLVLGSPRYLAPEQMRGEPVDARTDLYSLGAVLFELLTGRAPFEGDGPMQIVMAHQLDDAPDVRSCAPPERVLSEKVAAVCRKALAKLPDQRFQTAQEMSEAVDAALRERPGDALTCPSCNAALPAPTRFCGVCGASLSS